MNPAPTIREIFGAYLQGLPASHHYYRTTALRFLSYLQTQFPHLVELSELRRDPHWLGWLGSLTSEDPPLSQSTRRIYKICLRRILRDLAAQGHPLPSGVILPEDFSSRSAGRILPSKTEPQLRTYGSSSQAHPLFQPVLETHIQTMATTLRPATVRIYRVAVRRFLAYLQTEFSHLADVSELRRDPHLLGWLRDLGQQVPPLSPETRQAYVYTLRHLFQNLVVQGYALPLGLILPGDIPQRRHQQARRIPRPPRPTPPLQQPFDAVIQNLATTRRPSTIGHYRTVVRHFLNYLQTDFPQLRQLHELRRDPHLLGWFRHLCDQQPPLCNATRHAYLLQLRRLLEDLASQDPLLPASLILAQDFPRIPQFLPRALSPEQDQQIQQELRRTDDLLSNALLLTRATGIRIGECIHLSSDCLQSLGPEEWALHVPLGKLYTERLVPVDEEARQIIARIWSLRAQAPAPSLAKSAALLLPRSVRLYQDLRLALHRAAQRIGCDDGVTPHRLRHTYATEMIRLGVSLPVLMKLLGHKNIAMTMRYVQVTQQDLQREFHQVRRDAAQHRLPELPVGTSLPASPDLSGIRRALAATRYLLKSYSRHLNDINLRRKLRLLDRRLRGVASEMERFSLPEK